MPQRCMLQKSIFGELVKSDKIGDSKNKKAWEVY